MLLRGPDVAGSRLRTSAFVAYANGADPADSSQFLNVLRRRRPPGTALVDASTSLPTSFFSSGDPLTATGWVDSLIPHPHCVLSTGPFLLAPGDTQEVVVALIVGQGQDPLGGVAALRATAAEVRRLYDEDFASAPAPEILPLTAWPNPASGALRGRYSVPGAEARIE